MSGIIPASAGIIRSPMRFGAPATIRRDDMASGIYTPTVTIVSNIDSTLLREARWVRVGKNVSVYVRIDIDPNSLATAQMRLSLPIPPAFETEYELTGQISRLTSGSGGPKGGFVVGDVANQEVLVGFTAAETSNGGYFIFFNYRIP